MPISNYIHRRLSNEQLPENDMIENVRVVGYRPVQSPTPPQLTTVLMITFCIILNARTSMSCSEVATLTAQQSVCTVQKTGSLECLMTETTKINFGTSRTRQLLINT